LAERVGILGGTFDPIHNGHLALAEAARKQLALTRLVYLPAGVPWRKAGREIAPAEHRVEMVRLAVAEDPAAVVSLIEIEREGPSYTAETLEALANNHAGADLYFIMGEDALADLPNWREPERIVAFAKLAVARRHGSAARDEAWRVVPGIDERTEWLEMAPVSISASEIRRRIAAGEPVDGMLPPAVEAYIRENRLYERKTPQG
jgi:nicotinate-nucleotide adenylyltransferase